LSKLFFSKYPQLKDMRDKLYDAGAVYAAMSGSGSAVFGIFDVAPFGSQQWFPGCFVWEGIL
jgi:4-diphosphocytidyl-2-C-methyl-D-erythritol kinase